TWAWARQDDPPGPATAVAWQSTGTAVRCLPALASLKGTPLEAFRPCGATGPRSTAVGTVCPPRKRGRHAVAGVRRRNCVPSEVREASGKEIRQRDKRRRRVP